MQAAKQQIREKLREKCVEEEPKIDETMNSNCPSVRGRSKNLVKWIQEEFEDKNLDKAKRTLLVTLDDISKGYSNKNSFFFFYY